MSSGKKPAPLRVTRGGGSAAASPRHCAARYFRLTGGEQVRRGCGAPGLVELHGAGWKCLYCGNVIYRRDAQMRDLWFHFKWGREYWRFMRVGGLNYINGLPVDELVEALPEFLRGDLLEADLPLWFECFATHDEDEFIRVLKHQPAHWRRLPPPD